jgi:membrane protease YdiL (CAAX protease family)
VETEAAGVKRMNEIKTNTISSLKSFLCGIILILLLIHLIDNVIIFLTIHAIIQNPSIPKFRLISSAGQIIVFILFMVSLKPSTEELGVFWTDIRKPAKIVYCVGGLAVLLLVISSYFVMVEIKYFALATNIYFGLTTPIFEEVIFRGYCWNKLRKNNFSNRATLIMTSVIFGIFHLGYYYQIEYATRFHPDAPPMANIMLTKVLFGTLLGFMMGLLRWKSKKVFGPIIIHAIFNIVGK